MNGYTQWNCVFSFLFKSFHFSYFFILFFSSKISWLKRKSCIDVSFRWKYNYKKVVVCVMDATLYHDNSFWKKLHDYHYTHLSHLYYLLDKHAKNYDATDIQKMSIKHEWIWIYTTNNFILFISKKKVSFDLSSRRLKRTEKMEIIIVIALWIEFCCYWTQFTDK